MIFSVKVVLTIVFGNPNAVVQINLVFENMAEMADF